MNSTELRAKAPSLLGDFVSEVELAKALGVSRRTICRNFQQDGPPRIRFGRKVVMYRRSEVLAWLQRTEVHGISTHRKGLSR
jgi:predicted DNA-binding transcriptional regulator AlpA